MVEETMWSLTDRLARAVSDVTIGTVIVLVHVAMADRLRRRERKFETIGRTRSHELPRVSE